MRVLLEATEIAARLDVLANEIDRFYQGREITVVTMLNGAMLFASDLVRRMKTPLFFDSFACSSYVNDRSSGELSIRSAPKLPVAGRNILLVDDIFDTGLTLDEVRRYFQKSGAQDVRSCVLLDKKVAKQTSFRPDYVGFAVDDLYVVGYGLDSHELYRNLPFVGVLKD